jgi:hypothetical protein
MEQAMSQLATYHVLGFYLFDHEFSDDTSRLHQGTSLGRLSLLGYPDKLICMVLRRAGLQAVPVVDIFAEHWQYDAVSLGDDENGEAIVVNAFYTSLYPMFYDFGYLGVVLIPGLFVFFLVLHYKSYLRQQGFASLFVVIFLTLFFMVSVFNVKIACCDFQVILYCIVFRRPVSKLLQSGVSGWRGSRARVESGSG